MMSGSLSDFLQVSTQFLNYSRSPKFLLYSIITFVPDTFR